MHGDIVLNECECMVEESTMCLVFDLVGSSSGMKSNRVAQLNKVVKKTCVE